jgi:hypothetical protein
VQLLAHDRRLPIQPTPALAVTADLAVVLALLKDPRVQDAVLCTHSEVIGQVLARLTADGLALDQPLAWPKGSTWLLHGANGRLTLARYPPPLPLADALIPALQATWTPPGPGRLPAVREQLRPPSHHSVGQRPQRHYRRFM